MKKTTKTTITTTKIVAAMTSALYDYNREFYNERVLDPLSYLIKLD